MTPLVKAGVLPGSLFVRAFRAVGALSAWYSGCIKGASLCRLWKTSL